ncbi:MAG: SIS domain-containing protein [Chloroflexota bacterium]|nr:SIS domain-containing protein [Chloroflexota bacterium]
MKSEHEIIGDYLKGLRSCLEEIAEKDVIEIVDIIMKACSDGKKVVFMGNGGSATTASHFARDISIGTAKEGKPRVRAISLADSIAAITSLANDVGYNSVFKEQLIGQVDKGDVVIGISASGNSPNVLEAMEYARSAGAITVGFIGFGGGKLKGLSDKSIVLSSRDYGQVEDTHLVLDHIFTCLVKERIAGG